MPQSSDEPDMRPKAAYDTPEAHWQRFQDATRKLMAAPKKDAPPKQEAPTREQPAK